MEAIITVGVSASGKSTWASDFIKVEASKGVSWQRIERDCIRKNILINKGISSELEWDKWNWKWEKDVNQHVEMLIESSAANGYNIVVSDTNLNVERRNALKQKLKKLGYSVTEKHLPVTFEEAVKRDTKRKNGVGISVIATQFEQWHQEFTKKYSGTPDAPNAIMVDIDGTLAHMNKGRGPFEWDKVEQDVVDEEIASIVSAMTVAGWKIIILSGRDGVCKPQTERWLKKHDIHYDEIFMRGEGDSRKDSIVKSEIFWTNVVPDYNVKMVIDDRPQVTRMWRSIGVKVIQVGNPYIEF